MKALQLIYESAYHPDVLEMMGDVFDDVWTDVSRHYDANGSQGARLQLARITLSVYRDGMDASSLRQAAAKGMQSALVVSQLLRTA